MLRNNEKLKINAEKAVYLMEKAVIPALSIATVRDNAIATLPLGVTDTKRQPAVLADDNTVFQAASLSKPLFAYLVLKIIESGEYDFNLKTPLHTILSEARFPERENKMLTAEMVLSHQTGLPGIDLHPDQLFQFSFEPGTNYAYSGIGYAYLQKVLEKLTSLSLETLAKKYVFEPLHMNHSSFVYSDKFVHAVPHDDNAEPQRDAKGLPMAHAAASLFTTAGDYALFIRQWLKESNLHQAFDFDQAVSVAKDTWAIQQQVSAETLEKIAWNLGWGLQKTAQGTLIFHWGDMGDSKAFVTINAKDKTAIVYFANSWNGLAIARDMMAAVGFDVEPALEFLFKKYGYTDHYLPDWKVKQNYQTQANFIKYEKGGVIGELTARQQAYLAHNPFAMVPAQMTTALVAKTLNIMPSISPVQEQEIEKTTILENEPAEADALVAELSYESCLKPGINK